MKKLVYSFNWCIFIIFIIALSALDTPSWTPTIIVALSGLMLTVGAYILEQIKLHEEVMNDHEC